MRGEPQHDEVSVEPIQTVSGVGVVFLLALAVPDEFHDLVFPLPWCLWEEYDKTLKYCLLLPWSQYI